MSSFLTKKQVSSVADYDSSSHSAFSRRQFLKAGLLGIGSLSAISALSSCSTFDEFIFEDQSFLQDEVLIVGGGISGLFLAYQLRKMKTEFHLFEGSAQFGGRIRSNEGMDYGASLFDQSDITLKKLINEFNIKETALSKSQFYLAEGAEQLITVLKSRISGLMPYRNLRLRWKLAEIHKMKNRFELIFETPQGRRTIAAKKIALTLPPSQWGRVVGLLDLPEMTWASNWLQGLQPESIFKVTYPIATSVLGNMNHINKKAKVHWVESNNDLTLLVKNFKNNMSVLEIGYLTRPQFNFKTKQIAPLVLPDIETLLTLINNKTRLSLDSKRISTDNFFNWSRVELIEAAYFKSAVPWPKEAKSSNANFQVFGDYTSSVKPHTVEGALLEALRVSSIMS